MILRVSTTEYPPWDKLGTIFDAPDVPEVTAVDAEDDELPDKGPAGLIVDMPADD